MIPFRVLRKIYKVSWTKDNRDAIQLLNKLFYLMIALNRSNRIQDFLCVQKIFFLMIDSFILHGRSEAKQLLDRLLKISWINKRKAALYRSISAYNHLIVIIRNGDIDQSSPQIQKEVQKHTANFVTAFKQFTNFNEKDEIRIRQLIDNPSIMDEALKEIYRLSE